MATKTKYVTNKGMPDDILNMPIEIYLPLLEADEDNIKPVQKALVVVNGDPHYIERGKRYSIPYWLWRAAKETYPNL